MVLPPVSTHATYNYPLWISYIGHYDMFVQQSLNQYRVVVTSVNKILCT